MNILLDPEYWKDATFRDVDRDIERGTDVEVRDKNGNTPLILAAKYNEDPDVIEFLLDERADIEAENRYGETPIMLAARYNRNPEIVTTLINEGADWRTAARNGKTAWNHLQANPKLSRNRKLIKLLKPAYMDSYRGGSRRARLDRRSRRYR